MNKLSNLYGQNNVYEYEKIVFTELNFRPISAKVEKRFTSHICGKGLSYSPEIRSLFPTLTNKKNIYLIKAHYLNLLCSWSTYVGNVGTYLSLGTL
jgi:ABC-type branched-chain amino acid transport systems, ATPase component